MKSRIYVNTSSLLDSSLTGTHEAHASHSKERPVRNRTKRPVTNRAKRPVKNRAKRPVSYLRTGHTDRQTDRQTDSQYRSHISSCSSAD